MRPFNSRRFFRNKFFTKASIDSNGYASVTRLDASTADVPCVIRHGLDPERDKTLIFQGGFWADIEFFKEDYRIGFGSGTAPEQGETHAVDGITFTVKEIDPSGDIFRCKALANARGVMA